ncbi:MAG: TonB-dependent receptor [Blastocatellia bacterium]
MKTLFLLLSLSLPCAVWAQEKSAPPRLEFVSSGPSQIVDSAEQPIAGARIKVRNQNGVIVRELISNERGEFFVPTLPSGEYQFIPEVAGMVEANPPTKFQSTGHTIIRVTVKMKVAALQDAILVSATRTENPLATTPASTYVITAKDLQQSQHVNVLDALRASPGVAVLQTARRGGVTSLFVRGGESDYTKVLVDGIPLNDAGGAFDLSDLTIDSAQQIELVRGASSALYGSDAMSGVLQFITQRGTNATPALELLAEGGSFAFNRQAAKVTGANGGFDYLLSFSHLRTNGRDRNDNYQNRIAAANFGYRFNERTNVRVLARSENSGLGVPGATARYFVDPDERARRRRIATGLRFTDQTIRNWHQSVSFVYAENNQLGLDPAAQDLTKPNTPPDTNFAFNDFVSFFNNHQKRRGLRYQSDVVLPRKHLLSAGLEYEKETAVFDSGSRVAPERRNLGVFAQEQFFYASRFVLTAGLRVENNRADLPANFAKVLQTLGSAPFTRHVGYGTQVAPKVATLFLLNKGNDAIGATKLRASYGAGIKAATLVEAFSPNTFFLGNPGLKPERARSFDVGVEQLFARDRLRVEAVYFDNHFRDQIAYVGDPATFGGPIKTAQGVLTSFINNDRARARGLELSMALRPARQLSVSGSYTLTASQLTAAADVIDFNTLKLTPNPEVGLPLLRRPKHAGAVNITWTKERFDMNLNAFLLGRRRDVDPVTFSRLADNPGYARVDLAGGYHLTSRLSLFARIENLLNRNYQEVLGYPAYRLTFSAGLRVRLGRDK